MNNVDYSITILLINTNNENIILPNTYVNSDFVVIEKFSLNEFLNNIDKETNYICIRDYQLFKNRICDGSHLNGTFEFDIEYKSSNEYFNKNIYIPNKVSDLKDMYNLIKSKNYSFFDLNCRVYKISIIKRVIKYLNKIIKNKIELGNLFILYIDYLIFKHIKKLNIFYLQCQCEWYQGILQPDFQYWDNLINLIDKKDILYLEILNKFKSFHKE